MKHTQTKSQAAINNPFLLKFEGRMAQISKKGTLTTQLHTSLGNLLQRQYKKTKLTALSQKRADNILLSLNQIKAKNSLQMQGKSHIVQEVTKQKQVYKTNYDSGRRQLQKNVIISSFSIDFQDMLRQLDNLQFKKKKK